MIGRPSVMLTPWPKLAYFSTGRPWSWYIASTQSACSRYFGWNSVSAGYGPRASMPSRLRRLQHRRDDVDFLAPQIAALARVRIQAGDQDARLRQAELAPQVVVHESAACAAGRRR